MLCELSCSIKGSCFKPPDHLMSAPRRVQIMAPRNQKPNFGYGGYYLYAVKIGLYTIS